MRGLVLLLLTNPVFGLGGSIVGSAGLTVLPSTSPWQQVSGLVSLATATDNVVIQTTLTVQGAAFSVGISTFVVQNGQVSVGTAATTFTGYLNVIAAENNSGAPALVIVSSTTGNSIQLQRKGSNGSASTNAFSITDENKNSTTLGIVSVSTGQGAVKITHNYSGTPDGNSSIISMRRNGSGTASQVFFWDNDTDGDISTGTKTINGRSNSLEYFVQFSSGETILNGQGTRPKAELHVVSSSTANGDGILRVEDSAQNKIFEVLVASPTGLPTNPQVRVSSANGTATFVINQNGNVGIGTTAPGQALEIVGSMLISANYRTNSGLVNNAGQNNAQVNTLSTGVQIRRNINTDVSTSAVLSVVNTGSGNPTLVGFVSAGSSVAFIASDGAMVVRSTATNNSLLAGAGFQVAGGTLAVISGHITSSGTIPTTSNCNSRPMNANSNDMRGSVTFAGGAQTACTVNFINSGGVTTPFCTCADDSGITSVQCNPGAGTLTMSITVAANDTLSYICLW